MKTLLGNSLADSPNIAPCKTKDASPDEILPESFDWRAQFPHCVQTPVSQGNCSASYALATTSMVADRICQQSNTTVTLSAQEVIDCDKGNYGCDGGYVSRALSWGKRKGFIPESCYPFNGTKNECSVEDHLESNECRFASNFYKVIDYCLAQDDRGIKREILKNGPVIAQMVIYTDFLTYSSGLYHRTDDAFKFNGQHIVKILGWEKQGDGQEYWIVQNTFGEDWGEGGYVRVLASDKSTQLDFFAIGVAVYPYTMQQYYAFQELQRRDTQAETEVDLDAATETQ